MLEILASVGACTDKPFSALAAMVLERAALLSGCICILLSWDEPRRELVGRLKSLGVPVMVLVIVSALPDQPPDPGPMSSDPRNFHFLEPGNIKEGMARL